MTDQTLKNVTIYTDGACSGNPGPGGWGAMMMADGHKRELRGGEADTTNNRMELLAAIRALKALTRRSHVDLHTDSTYVRQGITKWIHGWKRNGWKTAARKEVKNADLWQELDAARQAHEVQWHWVKGHAGDPGNERADELARMGLQDARKGIPQTDERFSGEGQSAQPAFELHPTLAADTVEVADLPLCSLRLMNERRYTWLILAPKRADATEIIDLSPTDAEQLMVEIRMASKLLQTAVAPDKINVATLGNIVPQLHIHVIARLTSDPAWPGPVWGHSPVEPYEDDRLQATLEKLQNTQRRA